MIVNLITNHRSHIGQIFNPTALDFTLDYSFVTFLANLINILFVILAEAYIVEKANKCLDFTATIFILHLWITWAVYKFPTAI